MIILKFRFFIDYNITHYNLIMNNFIDFSSVEQTVTNKKVIEPIKKYTVDYDDTTCLYYKSHRIQRTDPITFEELNENNSFKILQMWDPYTGTRTENDPFGPIYFHPMNLLQHFYVNRLNGLWIDQSDEDDGLYAGYFGDAVGGGEDYEIVGRGIYPEKYLFRLPIPNCYLKKDHDMNIITMGPKLTNEEICSIDKMIEKEWTFHKLYKKIYKRIGSLQNMKIYYDIAISKDPIKLDLSILNIKKKNEITKQENYNLNLNRMAVEKLKLM
jgi:hypothetical protein